MTGDDLDTIPPESARATHTVDGLIAQADRIQVVPEVAVRVQRVVADESSSLAHLTQVIELDPALAASLLRVANSAYYSRGQPVPTVGKAIQRLGMLHTRDLVLALVVAGGVARPGDALRQGLWLHALRAGFIAREIARHVQAVREDEAFVAGLLHDLGVLVLYDVGPPEYRDVLLRAGSTLTGLDNLERHLFGFDHAEVGEQCMRHWSFPASLCLAVRLHHTTQGTLLTAVIQLADEIDTCLCVGLSPGDVAEQATQHRANERLARSADQFLRYMDAGMDMARSIASMADGACPA